MLFLDKSSSHVFKTAFPFLPKFMALPILSYFILLVHYTLGRLKFSCRILPIPGHCKLCAESSQNIQYIHKADFNYRIFILVDFIFHGAWRKKCNPPTRTSRIREQSIQWHLQTFDNFYGQNIFRYKKKVYIIKTLWRLHLTPWSSLSERKFVGHKFYCSKFLSSGFNATSLIYAPRECKWKLEHMKVSWQGGIGTVVQKGRYVQYSQLMQS